MRAPPEHTASECLSLSTRCERSTERSLLYSNSRQRSVNRRADLPVGTNYCCVGRERLSLYMWFNVLYKTRVNGMNNSNEEYCVVVRSHRIDMRRELYLYSCLFSYSEKIGNSICTLDMLRWKLISGSGQLMYKIQHIIQSAHKNKAKLERNSKNTHIKVDNTSISLLIRR